MKKKAYFIAQSFRKVNHAGVKPSTDFEKIIISLGAKNLGIRPIITNIPKLEFILNIISTVKALISMPSNRIVFLQYPMQFCLKRLFRKAIKKNNEVILIIHDINELRGLNPNYPEILQKASAIIVHTPSMAKYVNKYYNKNTIVLGLFDYLMPPNNQAENDFNLNTTKIVFAGNLSKAQFLDKLNFDKSSIEISVYGNNWDFINNPNLKYMGSVTQQELHRELPKYHFGLVWDGDEIDQCSGFFGDYLKINSPYKASSYLAAGLPIIIWSQMGIKNLIKDNNAGIVVDSLSDLPQIIRSLTPNQYKELRNNALALSQKLQNGEFTKGAINNCMGMI